jgi:hypothetical protein
LLHREQEQVQETGLAHWSLPVQPLLHREQEQVQETGLAHWSLPAQPLLHREQEQVQETAISSQGAITAVQASLPGTSIESGVV